MKILTTKRLNPKGVARRLAAALVVVAGMGFGLLGGGAGYAAGEPAKPVVRFTVMAWDAFDPQRDLVLNYKTKGELRTTEIAWRDRSLPLVSDGAGTVVFSRTVERDGKKTEMPVASATIPEGMTRALLVFGRKPSPAPGESPIRVLVIDDSYGVFPAQSVRFLNYSKLKLGGTVGGQAFEVAAGEDRVVPVTAPGANQLLPFKLMRRDEAGAWKKLRSTGLPMAEGLRVLVFLLDDPAHPGRVEMVMLRDRAEPPQTPPAEGPVTGTPVANGRGLRVNPAVR